MDWRQQWKTLAGITAVFLGCFYLPVGISRFDGAVIEALQLVKWYAREHVLLCLVPAFFIAGAVGVFISQASVMRYLGPKAKKVLAYGVASVSGTVLAVCSCTVLPLFAGIYRMGAGLGPAATFLYSGPAINILAIVLTARILGLEMGLARAMGAIVFSVVIGLLMHMIFRKEELAKTANHTAMPDTETDRPLWQNVVYFGSMVGILVFVNWGKPAESGGLWSAIFSTKWLIAGAFSAILAVVLIAWFSLKWWKIVLVTAAVSVAALAVPNQPTIAFVVGVIGLSTVTSTDKGPCREWFSGSWGFAKQILPLLFAGVLVAGFLLGSQQGHDRGIIPADWVSRAVGGNSLRANLFASVAGAFMYFATLTEVPILKGLMDAGMGKGPALALLLAGPALSLPNMLVIRSVMGTKKTVVFVLLVMIMATISGVIFGAIWG